MPILNAHTLDLISHSSEQTRRLGTHLGPLLQAGDLLCLEGDLGTGKTCLAQGIGRGLGILEPITSPTFTLVAEYHPPRPTPPLYHIDLYRLGNPVDEALDMGLEEYMQGNGICLIEWAERVKTILPDEHLWLQLRHLDTSKRGILITAHGMRYEELLARFRQSAFGI